VRISHRSALAAGIFAAAAATAAAVQLRPNAAERAARRARPVLSLAGVDVLQVRRAGLETTLLREAGRFAVTAPVEWPADGPAAAAAFAALETLDLVAVVSERAARHRELQVDDAAGLKVVARRAGRTLAELTVGKVIDDGTMVRIGGSAAVWRAAGNLRAIFDKSPIEWRDRSVTRFSPRDAVRIEIAARDGAHVELVRASPDAGPDAWRVAVSSVSIGRLDQAAARALIETLSSLSASGFADGVAAAAAGLAPPSLAVTVGLADGKAVSVLVGDAHGNDESYVAAGDRLTVFLVKRFNVDRFDRAPIQFRDKTLCDISDGDIVAFGVRRGSDSYAVERRGPSWQATAPKGLAIDSEKVASFATVFRGWSAPRLAEHPPPDAVARPQAVIVGRSPRARCTIRVGRELPDGSGYFVQTAASPDVLVVPKWMIDRIAVPLRQIQKA
jgi:hypothetical protein